VPNLRLSRLCLGIIFSLGAQDQKKKRTGVKSALLEFASPVISCNIQFSIIGNGSAAGIRREHPMKTRAMQFIAIAVLMIGIFTARSTGAQTRGPSTPEERARAVKVAHELEENPLAKDAMAHRQWMSLWIEEIPDITVDVCDAYFGALPDPSKGHSAEIRNQMVLSSTAFMIEHPDKVKDEQAVALSGLLGALKTYQAILKQDSASRWAHLDKLVQMREQGKLDDFVAETRKKCVREEEERDPNTIRAQAF
jgi:hypothetical protein